VEGEINIMAADGNQFAYQFLPPNVQWILDQDVLEDSTFMFHNHGTSSFDILWKKTRVRKFLTHAATKGQFQFSVKGMTKDEIDERTRFYNGAFKEATYRQIQDLIEYFRGKLKEESDWIDLETRMDL